MHESFQLYAVTIKIWNVVDLIPPQILIRGTIFITHAQNFWTEIIHNTIILLKLKRKSMYIRNKDLFIKAYTGAKILKLKWNQWLPKSIMLNVGLLDEFKQLKIFQNVWYCPHPKNVWTQCRFSSFLVLVISLSRTSLSISFQNLQFILRNHRKYIYLFLNYMAPIVIF